ncbi:MAG: hypothetical protein WC508_01250 [Patescibacteria group bacterium]
MGEDRKNLTEALIFQAVEKLFGQSTLTLLKELQDSAEMCRQIEAIVMAEYKKPANQVEMLWLLLRLTEYKVLLAAVSPTTASGDDNQLKSNCGLAVLNKAIEILGYKNLRAAAVGEMLYHMAVICIFNHDLEMSLGFFKVIVNFNFSSGGDLDTEIANAIRLAIVNKNSTEKIPLPRLLCYSQMLMNQAAAQTEADKVKRARPLLKVLLHAIINTLDLPELLCAAEILKLLTVTKENQKQGLEFLRALMPVLVTAAEAE